MITKQIISRISGTPTSNIKQIGRKQLFICPEAIYSYTTVLAQWSDIGQAWVLCDIVYTSRTTTRHINIIKRMYAGYII